MEPIDKVILKMLVEKRNEFNSVIEEGTLGNINIESSLIRLISRGFIEKYEPWIIPGYEVILTQKAIDLFN